jgi:hypothetical protein
MLEASQEKHNVSPSISDTLQQFVKKASQMRGLMFGNKIDSLLSGGLAPNTLTFMYGKNADSFLNILCGNAIRIFGGRSVFIDAANCFDPYLIVDQCVPIKSEAFARKFCEHITVFRAFTCYQLRKLVADTLRKEISKDEEDRVKSVFVTGIDSVFSEDDNTKEETETLQLLMAQDLARIASSKQNGVLFVVASSKARSEQFVSKCDTAIKLYEPGLKASLTKHSSRQHAEADLLSGA